MYVSFLYQCFLGVLHTDFVLDIDFLCLVFVSQNYYLFLLFGFQTDSSKKNHGFKLEKVGQVCV